MTICCQILSCAPMTCAPMTAKCIFLNSVLLFVVKGTSCLKFQLVQQLLLVRRARDLAGLAADQIPSSEATAISISLCTLGRLQSAGQKIQSICAASVWHHIVRLTCT